MPDTSQLTVAILGCGKTNTQHASFDLRINESNL